MIKQQVAYGTTGIAQFTLNLTRLIDQGWYVIIFNGLVLPGETLEESHPIFWAVLQKHEPSPAPTHRPTIQPTGKIG